MTQGGGATTSTWAQTSFGREHATVARLVSTRGMNAAQLDPYAPPTAAADVVTPARSGERFRVREVVDAAWQSYWGQPGRASVAVTLAAVLPLAFSFALGRWLGAAQEASIAHVLGTQFFSFLVGTYFSIGATRVALAAVRNERIRFATIVSGADVIVSAIGSALLVLACCLVGTILFIVPGIVAAMALWAAPWLVADGDARALEAFEGSLQLTRGARWRLLVLETVCGLLLLGGALCLGVGVLVALPVASFARAHAYLRLTGEIAPED